MMIGIIKKRNRILTNDDSIVVEQLLMMRCWITHHLQIILHCMIIKDLIFNGLALRTTLKNQFSHNAHINQKRVVGIPQCDIHHNDSVFALFAMKTKGETSTQDVDDLLQTGVIRNNEDRDSLVKKYLQRIGLSEHDDDIFFLKRCREEELKITDENLQTLLTRHLLNVPFENMDLHSHPPPVDSISSSDDPIDDEKNQKRNIINEILSTDYIPRRSTSKLPSLNVNQSLQKIIEQRRGGFCYELNLSFCWLLRQLGFRARLAVADVSCKQEVPAHVVVLVDDVHVTKNDHDSDGLNGYKNQKSTYLVDVGFGCPGVCDVILPLKYNQIHKDYHDDLFRFHNDQSNFPLHQGRFDTVLYRTRVHTPNEESPMYRFHSKDDLDNDAVEFQNGLEYVLNTSPTFNEKRLCVISSENGHITLGSDYVKWVERWETMKEEALPDEESWRRALFRYFGVRLAQE